METVYIVWLENKAVLLRQALLFSSIVVYNNIHKNSLFRLTNTTALKRK
jgi:hypothetical protein